MSALTFHPVFKTFWFAVILAVASVASAAGLIRVIDVSAWRYLRAESRMGVVDYCERTRHRVGGTQRESGTGTPIFRHYFSFDDPASGKRVSGTSYLTGDCLALGRQVRVEFPRGRSQRARIVGQRAKPYSAWLGLLLLVPALGLSVAVRSAWLALTQARRRAGGGGGAAAV